MLNDDQTNGGSGAGGGTGAPPAGFPVPAPLIAAVLTPTTARGATDPDVTSAYFRGVVADGADGLAVAVHTGRGDRLPLPARAALVGAARALTPTVVTAVWPHDDLDRWGRLAADAGATALLVAPAARDDPGVELRRLDRLSRASGLDLIAFDLYTGPYAPATLAAVLGHPAVTAYKPAHLSDAIACQAGIWSAVAAGVTVLTGEDRMFVPSLLWGARGALVGLAAAATPLTRTAFRAAHEPGAELFAPSRILDGFAAATFRPPYDGYVQRMSWIAADEGRIPVEFAVDPGRPAGLGDAERAPLLALTRRLLDEVEAAGIPPR
ncbi:hypothetical protein AB0M79_21175 [Polymorphospora sp. NPDC051019]